MIVIPAVDIMGGKCVRLVQGEPRLSRTYFDDPLEPSRMFVSQGAEYLHVVDLDAALGLGDNLDVVLRLIREIPAGVQVGGGIRNIQRAEEILNGGAKRVVLGTAAIQNLRLIKEAILRFGGEKVAVAVDVRDGEVVIKGWKEGSGIDYIEFTKKMEGLGVGTIIFTSVKRDGTLSGPAIKEASQLVSEVKIPVIASGGVGSLKDLLELSKTGVRGAIVGTALYEGKFNLRDAIELLRDTNRRL